MGGEAEFRTDGKGDRLGQTGRETEDRTDYQTDVPFGFGDFSVNHSAGRWVF